MKQKNSYKTELYSVIAVEKSLMNSESLVPYILRNDKTPSWDGNIHIYSKDDSNEGIRIVPVQVKGKWDDNFSQNAIKYSGVKISDLRNYLNNGGVMYFVVYIGKSGNNTQIYYSDLTPIKIQQIIDETSKKTTTIKLEKFPENNDDKFNLLNNFCGGSLSVSTNYSNKVYKTELSSVIAIEKSLIDTDLLVPYISRNDKTPSWDGDIHIYPKENTCKKEGIKRVSVQVKGMKKEKKNDFYQNEIRYSVDISDLNNYLDDGGVLYFVVYVGENGNAKIYYNALTPEKLHQILKSEQQEPLIFDVFPEDNKEKEILLKKIWSECEDLLLSLKRAKENARQIIGIDRLQKKAKQGKVTFKNFNKRHKELQEQLNTQRTIGYSKEELEIYYKLPKNWKIFGDSKAVPRWSLINFWGLFFIAYWSQISKNIPLAIGSIFVVIILYSICMALFKNVFKESAKFSDCLGWELAKWSNLFFTFFIVWLINKYTNIISFDFFNVPLKFLPYIIIICAVIRIITISLYNCARGKFAQLYSDDARNDLIIESILHKIPQNYWTEADIQKLIDVTTANKLEFLSDAIEVFESTKQV